MSTLQTTFLKHPDAAGNQITFTSGGDVNFDNGAVYLDSTNNRLGVGTTSPGKNVDIEASDPRLRLSSNASNNATVELLSNAKTSFIYSQNSGNLNLQANNELILLASAGTKSARIDSSGRLLVGTSTSVGNYKVQISGEDLYLSGSSSYSGYANIRLASDRARISGQLEASGGTPGASLQFYTMPTNGTITERMRIASSGLVSIPGVYSFTTAASANVIVQSAGQLSRATSSAKYKTSIETLEDSYADSILECRPVWYRSTSELDNPNYGWWGFIAEEVAEIDPRLVFWKTTDVTYDEKGSAVETPCDPEPEGVAYDRFVPHLLNLIKRQKEQIEAMEARLSALEAS